MRRLPVVVFAAALTAANFLPTTLRAESAASAEATEAAQALFTQLFAHGFVLLGAGAPLVVVAVDWCEIRNDAYEQWRTLLAEAAGTTAEYELLPRD